MKRNIIRSLAIVVPVLALATSARATGSDLDGIVTGLTTQVADYKTAGIALAVLGLGLMAIKFGGAWAVGVFKRFASK
jgi:hypothetical protein